MKVNESSSHSHLSLNIQHASSSPKQLSPLVLFFLIRISFHVSYATIIGNISVWGLELSKHGETNHVRSGHTKLRMCFLWNSFGNLLAWLADDGLVVFVAVAALRTKNIYYDVRRVNFTAVTLPIALN